MSIRESNGRRQPTRAVRTSTTRPLNYYARPFGYRASNTLPDPEPQSNEAPGFYPAITFFTDGLAALPKETMRQFTLLKETEGKAYQPDHSISDLLDAFNSLPPAPGQRLDQPSGSYFGLSMNNSVSGSANASVVDGGPSLGAQLIPDSLQLDEHAEHRAAIYREMQIKLREMTMVLDEKNMVLATANDTINRQLERLDSALPYIEEEISEEARLGSNSHWALPHMKDTKRSNGTASERVRRDAHSVSNLAHAAVAIENDAAASRSEARREAIAAKRSRNQHVDSDFDTERAATKKAHTSKAKKTQDERVEHRAAPSALKRRRPEKPSGAAMERTASTATNGRTAPTREAYRELPAGEARKKKPLPAPPTTKKRPSANSPSVASSPTRGGFGPSQRESSPGGVGMQRAASSRGRQNSALAGINEQTRGRPGSAHAQQRNTNGAAAEKSEARSVLLNNQRKAQNGADHAGDATAETGVRKASEAIIEPARAAEQLKREETEPAGEAEGSATANARSRGSSRPSKPGTPVAGANADLASATGMSRSRSTRGATNLNTTASAAPSPQVQPVNSPRKAAKKSNASRKSSISSLDPGEGLAAETAVEQDGEEGEGNDDNEPTYCKCGGVSYGSMVACDNENCPREWFHLECVGLKRMPGHKDKWYCSNECREEARGVAAAGR